MKKDIYIFIIKLIASLFFVYSAFFIDDKFIKAVSLIIWLIMTNLEFIQKSWLKYKAKREKYRK